jgi:predicted lipoprotein with Yx(FWY)xxD motif
MRFVRHTTAPVIKATVFLGVAALLVAGCASKKSNSAAASSASATTAAAAAASGAAAGGSAAPAGPATVDVKTGALGAYLTDASGNTLYLYTPDTTSTSTCYGQCVAFWPAFVTSAAPQAGSGADASLLGTSKRTDGTTQVTYNGHPLYFFKNDKAAGDVTGQGKEGTWFVVSPAGKQIGSATPPSASASTAAKLLTPSASKSTVAIGGY